MLTYDQFVAVARLQESLKRGERRSLTALVIARREREARTTREFGAPQRLVGHRLAKNDALGHCGCRHCPLCAELRSQKRLDKRRARIDGRRAERTDD